MEKATAAVPTASRKLWRTKTGKHFPKVEMPGENFWRRPGPCRAIEEKDKTSELPESESSHLDFMDNI
ncbi:hypothetical protein TNCV_2672851 [Trichonephila clavipes]|nr:hypothetical protein TNCV_2672851 [Trichonephila clavipes]